MNNKCYEEIKQYLIDNYNQYFVMSKLLDDYEYNFDEDNISVGEVHIWFDKDFFSLNINYSDDIESVVVKIFKLKKDLEYFSNINLLSTNFEYSKSKTKQMLQLIDYLFKNNNKKEGK